MNITELFPGPVKRSPLRSAGHSVLTSFPQSLWPTVWGASFPPEPPVLLDPAGIGKPPSPLRRSWSPAVLLPSCLRGLGILLPDVCFHHFCRKHQLKVRLGSERVQRDRDTVGCHRTCIEPALALVLLPVSLRNNVANTEGSKFAFCLSLPTRANILTNVIGGPCSLSYLCT